MLVDLVYIVVKTWPHRYCIQGVMEKGIKVGLARCKVDSFGCWGGVPADKSYQLVLPERV
jgi:hypothetical protein